MPNMYRVQLKSTGWGGSPGLNTFYFVGTPDPLVTTGEGAASVVERVRLQFSGFSGHYPTFWRGDVNPQVDMIDSATGRLTNTFVVAPGPVQITGAGGGSGPIAAALVVTLLTTGIVNGKRIAGKAFLSPLIVEGESDGTPTETLRNGAAAAVLGLVVPAGTPSLCVWHRPKLGAGGSAHLVTSVLVKDKYAVLTSRRD